jgi:hypothetical protein
MIRAASLRGFVPLVQTLGEHPAALLARHGLAEADLSSDDSLISTTSHDLLLDAAAGELRCPDLGLRLAESQDLSILGPLDVANRGLSHSVRGPGECFAVHVRPQSGSEDRGGRRETRAPRRRRTHLPQEPDPYAPQAKLGLGLFYRVVRRRGDCSARRPDRARIERRIGPLPRPIRRSAKERACAADAELLSVQRAYQDA